MRSEVRSVVEVTTKTTEGAAWWDDAAVPTRVDDVSEVRYETIELHMIGSEPMTLADVERFVATARGAGWPDGQPVNAWGSGLAAQRRVES